MDSAAYLRKHGWQGLGHSLNPDNTRALKKPLLVSRKIDVLGVGLNKNDSISDQWWLKAFDSSLKSLGTGQKGVLGQVRERGIKRGGLYGRFVKGQEIPGTIGERTESLSAAPQSKVQVSSTEQLAANTTPNRIRSGTIKLNESASEGVLAMPGKRKAAALEGENGKKRRLSNGVSSGVKPAPDTLKPGDKGYKAAKYAREKAKREAKRLATKASGANAAPLNESVEQRVERIRAERAAVKEEKKSKSKRRDEKKAMKQQAKVDRKLQKRIRRLETQEKRAQVAAIMAEQDKAAEEKRRQEALEKGLDLSEITPTPLPRKYPTAAEKRETKFRAMAIERGVDVSVIKEEHERRQKVEASVEKEYVAKHRAEKLGMDIEAYQSLPTPDWKQQRTFMRELRKLDESKRAQYEERAKAKGQSLTHYFMARALKNSAARDAAKHQTVQAGSSTLGFVIDGSGDATLAQRREPDLSLIRGKADMKIPAQEVMARIDTALWEGQVVKTLPKEIRKLRTVWMRARRRIRNEERLAAGNVPKRAKVGADGKTKDERKIARIEELGKSILRYSRRVKFGPKPKMESGNAGGGLGSVVVTDPVDEDPITKATRKRAEEAGAEFLPLDEKLLQNPNPNIYVPKGPVEQAPIGPGGEAFPVINVEKADGPFSTFEQKLARRVARRMIRTEKQSRKRGPKAAPVVRKGKKFMGSKGKTDSDKTEKV